MPRVLPMSPEARRWLLIIGGICVAAMAWRVYFIFEWRRDARVWGDALYYHRGGQLLADGYGFINPIRFDQDGLIQQAADHPPVYLLYLAFFSLLGFTSPTGHMIATGFIGLGSIVLAAAIGRRLAGERVGVIAALLVAFYPNIFSWEGMILSEPTALFGVLLTAWLAYRFVDRPSLLNAVYLGLAVGVATLSRAELLLLSVLVVVPLILRRSGARPWRERFAWLAVSGAACLTLLAPWVAFNVNRFEEPVYLSSGFEITLASVSCPITYYGHFTGYWSLQCVIDYLDEAGLTPLNSDESTRGDLLQREATEYIGENLDRLPVVIAARWGRALGVWDFNGSINLDNYDAGRPYWVAWTGAVSFLALVPLAVTGALSLRRRGWPVYPLAASFVIVWITATITFGQPRYRSIAEGSLCILAAIGIDAIWRAVRNRTAGPATTEPRPDTAEEAPIPASASSSSTAPAP